jgi:hypothetical protein
MMQKTEPPSTHRYQRYHIETRATPDSAPHPSRFRVKVKKHRLALLLLKELFHYRGKVEVVVSRPCMYGVFSGPVGGFAPREHLCVGCLRCTTQYPEMVTISPNPERRHLGDSYFTPDQIDTITYEAQTGRVPVRGAGYRGKFGGAGWDAMWTDMSEIVRPTRDGIHGREFISTVVDIGERPSSLAFDSQGQLHGKTPRTLSIPLPILFDIPPPSVASEALWKILAEAARETETLAIVPLVAISKYSLSGPQIVPLISPDDQGSLDRLQLKPRMIELAGWDEKLYQEVRARFPESIVSLRLSFASGFEQRLLEYVQSGVRVFHLIADYHGRSPDGQFALELIRKAHKAFVEAGLRDEVTLLGSGGIVAAEHVPKAIICGLDVVALDTPLLVALQARFLDECADRETSRFQVPIKNEAELLEWGVQRLKNMLASWRDQLLEVLGAMGLREVRRLRGEIGRAMLQSDLEREAFAGIEGYGK